MHFPEEGDASQLTFVPQLPLVEWRGVGLEISHCGIESVALGFGGIVLGTRRTRDDLHGHPSEWLWPWVWCFSRGLDFCGNARNGECSPPVLCTGDKVVNESLWRASVDTVGLRTLDVELLDDLNQLCGRQYRHTWVCVRLAPFLPFRTASSNRSHAWQKKCSGYCVFRFSPNAKQATTELLVREDLYKTSGREEIFFPLLLFFIFSLSHTCVMTEIVSHMCHSCSAYRALWYILNIFTRGTSTKTQNRPSWKSRTTIRAWTMSYMSTCRTTLFTLLSSFCESVEISHFLDWDWPLSRLWNKECFI